MVLPATAPLSRLPAILEAGQSEIATTRADQRVQFSLNFQNNAYSSLVTYLPNSGLLYRDTRIMPITSFHILDASTALQLISLHFVFSDIEIQAQREELFAEGTQGLWGGDEAQVLFSHAGYERVSSVYACPT